MSGANIDKTGTRAATSNDLQKGSDAATVLSNLADLVGQLKRLHAAGKYHGNINPLTVHENEEGGILLSPPSASVTIDGTAENSDNFPPEFRGTTRLILPTTLTEAKALLTRRKITANPVRIDLFQTGAFACNRLTGESVDSYLSSPRTVSRVPPLLRPVIDGALGTQPDRTFATAEQLAIAIATAQQTGGLPADGDIGQKPVVAPALIEAVSIVPAGKLTADTPATQRHRVEKEELDIPFDRLGHYEIIRRIGHGGMGDVYLGYEADLDRHVAIKVLPQEFSREADFVARFRQEAAAAARLSHPNIVQIFFAGEAAGYLYFAMQHVDGESLSEVLERHGSLPIEQSVTVMRQVLSGLAHAHQHGMVHRDIKPANLLIDHSLQRALLADFGLVKFFTGNHAHTATGTVMGTAEYMSPEQGRGHAVDGRSDLYSLGIVVYRMLSGRLPFSADETSALIFQHVYETPLSLTEVLPQLPLALSQIVDRLMSKNPDDRYANAESVLEDLQNLVGDSQIGTSAPDAAKLTPGSTPRSGRESTVILSPRFSDPPVTLEGLDEAVRPALWPRLRERLLSGFGRVAPEVRDELRNTQQQVDGAIVEYAKRRDALLQHQTDGKAALELLIEQQDDWQQAQVKVVHRLANAPDERTRQELANEKHRCHKTIAELQKEIDAQQHELGHTHSRLAQVTTTLDRLRHQRALLNARLRVAEARALVLGGKLSKTNKRRWKVVAYLTTCVAIVVASVRTVREAASPTAISERQVNPVPMHASVVETTTTAAGDVGRFPKAFLFGSEGILDYVANCITFDPNYANPNNLLFAMGCNDGAVRIGLINRKSGNTTSLSNLKSFAGHRHSVSVLAYGPQSSLIASGDTGGEIRIWDTKNANQEPLYRVLAGHTDEISMLKFNADSSRLLSASESDRTVRVWDVLAERELEMISSTSCKNLSWVPGQQRLILATGLLNPDSVGGVGFQTLTTVQFLGTEATTIGHSIDGKTRVTLDSQGNSENRDIAVWYPAAPHVVDAFGKGIELTALTADRSGALTATKDGSLALWDIQTGKETGRLVDRSLVIERTRFPRFTTLAISPDGKFAASATKDKHLQFWRLPDLPMPKGQLRRFDVYETVHVVNFSSDGKSVAAGCRTGIKYRNLDEKRVYTYEDVINVKQPVTALASTGDGHGYAFATGLPRSQSNFLAVQLLPRWRRNSFGRTIKKSQGHTDAITGVVLLDNDRQMLSGCRDGTLRFWSVDSGMELDAIDVDIPINSIARSPDGRRLLVAGDDSAVRVFDLETKVELAVLSGHSFLVQQVSWSPDGAYFISAGGDGSVRVWNAETLQTVHVLTGHEDRVNSARLTNYGRFAVTGGEDGTVRYWDVVARQEIAVFRGHTGPVLSIDVNTLGTRAVSGGLDRTIRVWSLDRAAWNSVGDRIEQEPTEEVP